MDKNRINFNTALTGFVGVMVILVGFFVRHTLEQIETNQRQLWERLMPRHEIEVQLEGIKGSNNRVEAELIEIRQRVSKVEMEAARGRRDGGQ